MSSNGTESNGRSAVSFIDESTGGAPVGDLAKRRLLRDGLVVDPVAALACAAVAVARVEQDIECLWRDSLTAQDPALSERLAEVSHALQRAARLLEQDRPIG